jgi:hypothetical protein
VISNVVGAIVRISMLQVIIIGSDAEKKRSSGSLESRKGHIHGETSVRLQSGGTSRHASQPIGKGNSIAMK